MRKKPEAKKIEWGLWLARCLLPEDWYTDKEKVKYLLPEGWHCHRDPLRKVKPEIGGTSGIDLSYPWPNTDKPIEPVEV